LAYGTWGETRYCHSATTGEPLSVYYDVSRYPEEWTVQQRVEAIRNAPRPCGWRGRDDECFEEGVSE